MQKTLVLAVFLAFLLTPWLNSARAQAEPESKPSEAISSAVPDHFDLEKTPIPVLRVNSAVLRTGKGAQVVVALLDTTKSSARIHRKYSGLIIAQGKVSVCGISLDAGGYGFGLAPPPPGNESARFAVYTKEGDEVGECPAKRDTITKDAGPLAASAGKGGVTRLTLFRYFVELQ
jgi:hypothetical protein